MMRALYLKASVQLGAELRSENVGRAEKKIVLPEKCPNERSAGQKAGGHKFIIFL